MNALCSDNVTICFLIGMIVGGGLTVLGIWVGSRS